MGYMTLINGKVEGPWEFEDLIWQPDLSRETMISPHAELGNWRRIVDVFPKLEQLFRLRDILSARCRQLQAALGQREKSHQEAFGRLREEHARELASLRERQEAAARELHERLDEKERSGREALQLAASQHERLVSQLKAQNAEQHRACAVAEADLRSRHERALSELRAELTRQEELHRRSLAETEARLGALAEALRQRLADQERAHQAAVDRLADQSQRLSERCDSLQVLNIDLESDSNRIKKELEDARSEKAELLERLQLKSRELRSSLQQRDALALEANHLQELQADIERRKEHAADLSRRLDEALRRAESAEMELRHAQSGLEPSRQELARVETLAAERDKELRYAQGQLEKAQERADQAEGRLRAHEAKSQAREQELQEVHRALSGRLEAEMRSCVEAREQVQRYQEELDSQRRSLEKQGSSARNRESDLLDQIDRLKGILVQKESRIEMFEARLQAAESRSAEPLVVAAPVGTGRGRGGSTGGPGGAAAPSAQEPHRWPPPAPEAPSPAWLRSRPARFYLIWGAWIVLVTGLGLYLASLIYGPESGAPVEPAPAERTRAQPAQEPADEPFEIPEELIAPAAREPEPQKRPAPARPRKKPKQDRMLFPGFLGTEESRGR